MLSKRCSLFLFFTAGVGFANHASADLYGYVDENGRAHVSTVKLNGRYMLFKRSPAAETLAGKLAIEQSMALPSIDTAAQRRYRRDIADAAKAYRIEAALLHAIIAAESAYDPFAVSTRGAIGLMQVMPETAERYGIKNVYDPQQNIRAGASYLRDLLRIFNSDLNLVLSAYNAGLETVLKYGSRIPPYPETLAYVPKVLAFYKKYREMPSL